ncbi:hypothetical protein [Kingella bonacorsii]|nr:hypothetical protein [Kingella bonacorsii]
MRLTKDSLKPHSTQIKPLSFFRLPPSAPHPKGSLKAQKML